MKTGTFKRDYKTNETRYVVEGYSASLECAMYPSTTWSWTDWQPRIVNTYETKEDAVSDISSGYLHDMIAKQGITDIKIYGITTMTECLETRRIVSFDIAGKALDHVEPVFATDAGALASGDYCIIDERIYCLVTHYKDNRVFLDVISGRWQMVLYYQGADLYIDPESDGGDAGNLVTLSHIGVPDPTKHRNDYNHQLEFYRQNFAAGKTTSTKLTIAV